MEDQCTSLNWEFSFQKDGMEELRHSLLYTAFELETTIMSAKEEILRREYEVLNLKDLLNRAIKEKDEIEEKCQNLIFENRHLLLLQQNQQQQKNQEADVMNPQSESESSKINASSDSDDNTIQSSQTDPITHESLFSEPPPSVCRNSCEKPLPEKEKPLQGTDPILLEPLFSELPPSVCKNACEKPLPEKGKLLQAVIEAGPLLQNLLLAGPLPHWQHPPPLLNSIDIPPVVISALPSSSSSSSQFPNQSSCIDIRKRSNSLLYDVSEHPHNKYQKVTL